MVNTLNDEASVLIVHSCLAHNIKVWAQTEDREEVLIVPGVGFLSHSH